MVMGVLDVVGPGAGAEASLDDLVRRAGLLVEHGADLLDLELADDAPGRTEDEELEAVARAVEAVAVRIDAPLSVATSRAVVVRAAFGAGAVMANDRTGCADNAYLAAVVERGATLAAGHSGPVDVGPDTTADAVEAFLCERVGQARAAGIPSERIVIDAGIGRGKSARQALALLRASDRFADLGHPVLLSVADATFAGALSGPAEDRGHDAAPWAAMSLAATALGAVLGCRLVRTRDVAAHRQVCAVLGAVDGAAR